MKPFSRTYWVNLATFDPENSIYGFHVHSVFNTKYDASAGAMDTDKIIQVRIQEMRRRKK